LIVANLERPEINRSRHQTNLHAVYITTRPPQRSIDYYRCRKNILAIRLFLDRRCVDILRHNDREAIASTLRIPGVTMKRLLSALVASVALLAAATGVAHADSNQKCEGPASYCNVFFGN